MSEVTITVTNFQTGTAYLTSYPYRPNRVKYRVPLYQVTVSGNDKSGNSVSTDFDAIRFGVKRTQTSAASVVGLADRQEYTLSWSFITTMNEMAWRVYGGFFVHRGPDNPITQNFGSIGCIEITGSGKWAEFNALIVELAGCKSESDVSNKGLAKILYHAATRPPLIIV
jgi:hypothetical protein